MIMLREIRVYLGFRLDILEDWFIIVEREMNNFYVSITQHLCIKVWVGGRNNFSSLLGLYKFGLFGQLSSLTAASLLSHREVARDRQPMWGTRS